VAKAARNVVRFDLKGADELSKSMLAVPRYMRTQVLKKAVNKAGRIMVPPLRRATPKSKRGSKSPKAPPSGGMRKATGIVLRKYKGGALQSAYVGHRWPAGAAAHLVDQGTKVRQTKKGYNRGRVEGRKFFNPVVQAHRSQVNATLKQELATGLTDAVGKYQMKQLTKAIKRGG
jgi:hypothetical protein